MNKGRILVGCLLAAFISSLLLTGNLLAKTPPELNAIEVHSGHASEEMLKKGKWNLVAVWALDCVICEEQKPSLAQFHRTYGQLNVVGLSADGMGGLKDVRQRLKEQPVPFDNYIAEHKNISVFFKSHFQADFYVTPTYILYSPDGKLSDVHAGPLNFSVLQKILRSGDSTASSADIVR